MGDATTSYLPNRKQLIALSQLILIVWAAAFFFRLRLVESAAARKEFISLAALNSLSKLPIHAVFADRAALDVFAERAHLSIQQPVTDWLKADHPDLHEKQTNARQEVVDWLMSQGVSESVVKEASGKGHGDSIPFLFFRTRLGSPSSQYYGEAGITSDPPTGFLLDETVYWRDASTLRIVTALADSPLPRLDFKIVSPPGARAPTDMLEFAPAIEESANPVIQATPRTASTQPEFGLGSVHLLDTDELELHFVEEMKQYGQQASATKSIRIPVTTTRVSKSWIELLGSTLQAEALVTLAQDKTLPSTLNKTYGRIQIKQALDITSHRMLDSYGNVKLLGFDFTPTSFWMFVGAILLVLLTAIALQLRYPYGEQKDEATMLGLHLFLKILAVRAVLWMVVPLTALLLVMPEQDANSLETKGYWGLMILVGSGGIFVTWLSARTANGSSTTSCCASSTKTTNSGSPSARMF